MTRQCLDTTYKHDKGFYIEYCNKFASFYYVLIS